MGKKKNSPFSFYANQAPSYMQDYGSKIYILQEETEMEEKRDLFERCEDVANNWSFIMPMMAMEECGELIQAISKFERGSKFRENNGNNGKFVWNGTKLEDVVTEMANVFISCSALCHQYGITEDDIIEAIDRKLLVEKKR